MIFIILVALLVGVALAAAPLGLAAYLAWWFSPWHAPQYWP